jgi:hypothetical protein
MERVGGEPLGVGLPQRQPVGEAAFLRGALRAFQRRGGKVDAHGRRPGIHVERRQQPGGLTAAEVQQPGVGRARGPAQQPGGVGLADRRRERMGRCARSC